MGVLVAVGVRVGVGDGVLVGGGAASSLRMLPTPCESLTAAPEPLVMLTKKASSVSGFVSPCTETEKVNESFPAGMTAPMTELAV